MPPQGWGTFLGSSRGHWTGKADTPLSLELSLRERFGCLSGCPTTSPESPTPRRRRPRLLHSHLRPGTPSAMRGPRDGLRETHRDYGRCERHYGWRTFTTLPSSATEAAKCRLQGGRRPPVPSGVAQAERLRAASRRAGGGKSSGEPLLGGFQRQEDRATREERRRHGLCPP